MYAFTNPQESTQELEILSTTDYLDEEFDMLELDPWTLEDLEQIADLIEQGGIY